MAASQHNQYQTAYYLGCCMIVLAALTLLRCSTETETTISKIALAIKADLHRLLCLSMCRA
jgi:hypothetical protein